MNDIYLRLYDLTVAECGGGYLAEREVFEQYAQNNPWEVNLYDLLHVEATSKKAFLRIAYIRILNRPIDDGSLMTWSKMKFSTEQEFREAVIKRLVLSDEAAIKYKDYVDNIFEDEMEYKYVERPKNYLLNSAKKIYHRMPEFFQRTVRKARGIDNAR